MSMNHMFMEQEELAFLIAGKYVMIQECTDGYDYSLLDEEFHLIDGGVYDDQSVSITEALHVIVDDLKEHIRNGKNENDITENELDNCFQFDAWIPVDYDELSEKAMTVENTILKEETAMSNNNVNQEMFRMIIVYEDWRDRQFPPEIIGLYTKETDAHKSVEDKERELISDGYKIGEDVRVICKNVDVSDKCADEEHISYERLKRIAQLLLIGLLIDGINEAFIYMNETVGLSAKEAAILLSDSGEFREEEYESYIQESV